MMDTNKKLLINYKTQIHTESGVWTKASVQAAICNSDKFLERTITLIHSKQNLDERRDGVTKYWNFRGWAMVDAKRGKRWAEFVSRGYGLREWEKAKVRSVMKKYWRQVLAAIAVKEGLTPVRHKSEL